MTEVLLTHSYFMRFDRKQWRAMQPYPPLGTLYAASVLRNAGITVSLFDSMLAQSELELKGHMQRLSPKIIAIYDDSFNYLTKMCLERMRLAAFSMIEIAKREGSIVVVSSSDSADHAKEYLTRGADYVIKGEGEITLRELCESLLGQRPEDIPQIDGLSFLVNGRVIETAARKPMRNLDSLPLPAWDLVDIENYRRHWLHANGYFSMNVVTTRGCPFGCNWCAKPIYGRGYNSRSPRNVVEELVLLKERFRPDHIWFCDDIFGLKPGWLCEFQKEVQVSGLNLKYKCLSRPDLLLKENSFSALASSGCSTVWIGAESGVQKILDAMEKGTTVDQIRQATRKLKQNGIRVGYFVQFGYPGEHYKDILETIELVKQEMPDEIGMSVSYPLPNTKFHKMVEQTLGEKRNWLESNDLAMLFPGEFKPHFYRTLHKVLHKLHRIRRIVGRREKITARTLLAFLFNFVTLPIYRFVLELERGKNPERITLSGDLNA
jgi:anaerobic magnesium-protoporphyrin IX monomethyl ester cyclase